MIDVQTMTHLLHMAFLFIWYAPLYLLNRRGWIQTMATHFSRENILYIKLFQAIALNREWVDEETNQWLLHFTDHAPWTPEDVDVDMLHTVAKEHKLLFRGNEVPLNAGMISLVFMLPKIEHPEERVIVKIKRTRIDAQLEQAIQRCKGVLWLLHWVIDCHAITSMVEHTLEDLRSQTNLALEAKNTDLLRENCKGLRYVKIPTIFSNPHPSVIVMEYLQGQTIRTIQPEDRYPFAKAVVKFGLVTGILHGVTHGDLHAGNILFFKDDADAEYPHKIGVLDFGMVTHLPTSYKEVLLDIFAELFSQSPRETAEKLLNSSLFEPCPMLTHLPNDVRAELLSFVTELLQDIMFESKRIHQVQLYKCLSKLRECVARKELHHLGVRPSDTFVKMQLVIGMAHGVTLSLCNNNFVDIMDECIDDLFHPEWLKED